VKVITSPLLGALPGVRHAFFTREGGVSGGIYESLNAGLGSKDDPAHVAENRRRAAARFSQPPEHLLTCFQIHSPTVLIADGPWGEGPEEADGVATKKTGLICGALAADCAPVLIADAKAGVVAAAHAGWKGALTGVVAHAVEQMKRLGADRADMTAAIGPCIGPASYEVGLEFLERFEAADPDNGRFFSSGASPDKRQFDLPAFVLARLKAAGVNRAEWVGHDTCADEAFFSNRRAFHRGEADYGRLLSAIMLRNEG
jgi:YfiH family protein